MNKTPVVLVLACIAASVACADTPHTVISFDDGFSAITGDKITKPIEVNNAHFTEGLRGKALLAEKGIVLRYPRTLLPKKNGSVSMWVRLTRPLNTGGWRFFFSDGTTWGPIGMPRLWLQGIGNIRFDMDGGRRFFMRPVAPWPVGVWKHFVMTWDAEKGTSWLYINGKLMGQWKPFDPWTAQPTDSFRIGSGLDYRGKNINLPAYAAIDEVRIYNTHLDEKDVASVFREMKLPSLSIRNQDNVVPEGTKTIRFKLKNDGHGLAKGKAYWSEKESLEFTLAPGEDAVFHIDLAGKAPGLHSIPVTLKNVQRIADQTIHVPVFIQSGNISTKPLMWKMVARVNCTNTPPVSVVGEMRIVKSPIGDYREAGPHLNDRFVYAFPLSGRNRWVKATITYPDDKVRTAGVSNWGPPQETLGSGYACGDETPVTNTMRKRSFVFFVPRERVGIVFSTEANGQPVAIAELTVEEANPPLAPAVKPPVLGANNHRRIGLYWEDPVITRCFGLLNTLNPAKFEAALHRCMNYCQWAGLNEISYPAVWFRGPLYDSQVESGYPFADRNHPPDYLQRMAKQCDIHNVKYYPSLNVWKLGSLRKHTLDPAEVIAGKPSANCVNRKGQVIHWGNHNGYAFPMANVLHPKVQESIRNVLHEMAGVLSKYDSFGGIDLYLWPGSFLSLQGGTDTKNECSYDDYSIKEFAKEIGQTPPGKIGQADRFVKRVKWIHDDPTRLKAWREFRCRRLAAFYSSLADEVANAKPGAKLGIGIYDPSGNYRVEGADMHSLFRRMGLDIQMLAKDPHIRLRRFIHPMLYRWTLRYNRPRPKNLNLSNTTEFNAPFVGLSNLGVILHHQYFETARSGNLKLPKPFASEEAALAPNWGLRVTEPLPTGRDCLRYYAFALKNFDPVEITVGGYVLGTQGIESDLRLFAQTYSALPAIPFKSIQSKDGLLVRSAMIDKYTWTYLVNLSDSTKSIESTWPKNSRNAVTGSPIKTHMRLNPYELRALVSRNH